MRYKRARMALLMFDLEAHLDEFVLSVSEAYTLLSQVVNFLLRGWMKNLETEGSVELPLVGGPDSNGNDNIDKDLEFVREGSKKSVSVRMYGSTTSLSDQITSLFKNVTLKL